MAGVIYWNNGISTFFHFFPFWEQLATRVFWKVFPKRNIKRLAALTKNVVSKIVSKKWATVWHFSINFAEKRILRFWCSRFCSSYLLFRRYYCIHSLWTIYAKNPLKQRIKVWKYAMDTFYSCTVLNWKSSLCRVAQGWMKHKNFYEHCTPWMRYSSP